MNILCDIKHKCVVVGSFRKYYHDITKIIEVFEHNNIEVTSPHKSWILNKEADFVILESDTVEIGEDSQIHHIEQKVLNKIDEASFVYLYNPDGYVGISTAFEIGYAYNIKKPIYAAFQPADKMIAEFINGIVLPTDISRNIIGVQNEKFSKCNTRYYY